LSEEVSIKMTSKKSTGKVELDVQKMRDEGNWKRLIELTETGKIGSINGYSKSMCHIF